MDTLVVSTGLVLLICLLAHLLRLVVRRVVTSPEPHAVIQECIAASEMCGTSFEIAVIGDIYGVYAYAVYYFLLTFYQNLAWGDANACPYLSAESWWLGRRSFAGMLSRVLAGLAGGWLTWRYMRAVWWLELAAGHQGRWAEQCTADLQVSPLHGALVEGGAVLLCRLVARALEDRQHRFGAAIDSFCGTSLVIAGFNYSGGYYNPMLASALKMGCSGHTVTEHLAVYWGAATVGALASTQLYPLLRPTLTGSRDADDKRD